MKLETTPSAKSGARNTRRKPSEVERKILDTSRSSVSMPSNGHAALTTDERRRMIAQAAYYHAARRGFEAGHELDDWLAAEQEMTAIWPSSREFSRNAADTAQQPKP